jgi:thiamine kinase-like enzyme
MEAKLGHSHKLPSFLRRIFGPVNKECLWRIRRNDELKQLYRELEISEVIRFKQLQWAGHVIRMEEHRIPKKAVQA